MSRTENRRRRLTAEFLERRDLLASDFGDAPTPYPTTLADDGARHVDVGPRLGASRDTEPDGQPSPAALADGADENGVTIGQIYVGQVGALVIVNVQNGPAKLDAWIDFNRNGRWDGDEEKIASSLSMSDGFNSVRFDVPIGADSGLAYSRFRLSTAGGLGVTGEALDGEIEDHPLSIAGLAPTDVVLPHHLIDDETTPEIGAFAAADVDGDADVDLVASSPSTNQLAWFENDGTDQFQSHLIDHVTVSDIVISDLDRDGDKDIVVAQGNGDRVIAWYENVSPGDFVARSINGSVFSSGAISVDAGDIDADGDIDIAFGVPRDNSVYWFANRGDMTFDLRPTSAFGYIADLPKDLTLVDFEGDGDLDVFVTDEKPNDGTGIVYFENLGSGGFGIDSLGGILNRTFMSFDLFDLDSDGDLDLLTGASTGKIEWFEYRGAAGWFNGGTLRSTGNAVGTVRSGDLDGDGDTDVVATLAEDDQVLWYRNEGNQVFTEILIRSVIGPREVVLVDLDQDHDLDVVTASTGIGVFAWHRNLDQPDFGDAPEPYPTAITDFGAYHAASGPRLGPTRDVERDGQSSANADGDGADEDGVLFGDIKPGQMAGFNIDLQNASAAKVTAWIDWDDDGVWEPEERIRTGADVIPGLQTLNYNVPPNIQSGRRMARVRIGSETITDPTGYAADGEIEDYQVVVGGDVVVQLSDEITTPVEIEFDGTDLLVIAYGFPNQVLSSTPLAATNSLTIDMGSFRNEVIVNFLSGFFALPDGIDINGVSLTGQWTVAQHVEIRGTDNSNATYKTQNLPVGNGQIEVEQHGVTSVIRLSGTKDVDINRMVQISLDGELEAEFNGLRLDADQPIQLGPVTKFTGYQFATIVSSSPIVFGGDLVVDVAFRGGVKVGASARLFHSGDFQGEFATAVYPANPVGTAWDNHIESDLIYVVKLFDIAQVDEVVVNDDPNQPQHSNLTEINVTFEDRVEIAPGAFQVIKRGPGGGVVDHSFTLGYVQGNSVATINFTGGLTRGANNALVDGNYQLTIDPNKVRRYGSTVLLDGDGDQQQGGVYEFGTSEIDNFFALLGDSDGDRDVDGQDYGRFGLTFLKPDSHPAFNTAFDSDGDGDVDGQDYGRFGQRFLKKLPFE
ncbi:FG-GAP-like repeat-containing protein [Rhodopirellula sp. JC639]|uniref:FG-GAP-like repeat-containing protein n=1 Tax=Stieleria mannarensis TaxID=2755585 RepID=UPI0016005FA8|nr:FG-GAP-like repeat-containing protein [Rhodopirellula sp. JC639]